MAYPEYYKVLGLKTDASPDEVKQAYVRLAKKYHPDTHSGDKKAEEKLKRINEAYNVLKDLAKRAEYDYSGGNGALWRQNKYSQSFASFSESVRRRFRFVIGKLFLLSFLIASGIFLYAHRDPSEPKNWFKMLANSTQAVVDGGKQSVQFGISRFNRSPAQRRKVVEALFYMVRNGNIKILDYMLQVLPADSMHFYINATDKENHNRTLLMEAQKPEIIVLLLDAGAIVNQTDDLGETALTLAVRNGNAVATELLLQAGANALHTLPDGSTPLQLAMQRNDTVIMILLQSRIRH